MLKKIRQCFSDSDVTQVSVQAPKEVKNPMHHKLVPKLTADELSAVMSTMFAPPKVPLVHQPGHRRTVDDVSETQSSTSLDDASADISTAGSSSESPSSSNPDKDDSDAFDTEVAQEMRSIVCR